MNATQDKVRLTKLTLKERVLTLDFSGRMNANEVADDFVKFCRLYGGGDNNFYLRRERDGLVVICDDVEYQVKRSLNPPLARVRVEGNKVYINTNVRDGDVSTEYFPLLYELEMEFRENLLRVYVGSYVGRLRSEGLEVKRL